MKRTLYDRMMARISENRKKGQDKNIGKEVGNGTTLVERIGEGAMGAVYLGYDTKLDREVAVKVLLRENFKDEKQFEVLKALIIKEGRNLARVKHKGVIEIYEMDDKFPALIMELVEDGEDLQSYLYKKRNEWGTLGFRLWFLSMMEQVASALGAAHAQGVVHKDLKFGNIMIFKDSEGKWKIKIIDFGLAQNLTKVKLSHGLTLMGSPSYMAPEQWEDHWQLDARADVYSFGVMLFEILMQQDYHETNDNLQIMKNAKDSLYVQRRVGHLPIHQRTVFEFFLAAEKSRRAGGMLEVKGVLRTLRLALIHQSKKESEASFSAASAAQAQAVAPSSHAEADAAEEEFEESLETPAPVQVPSDPPIPEPKSVRYKETMLGHPGPDGSVIPGAASEPEPAIASTGESVDISMSEFDRPLDEDEGPVVFNFEDTDEQENKRTRKAIWTMLLIAGVIFTAVLIPLAYQALTKEHKSTSDDPAPTLTSKAPKPKAMKPVPVMKVSMKPKPMKIAPKPMKPVKPVITKITPPKPLPPKAPAKGDLPSLEYTVHLFNQEDKWCKKNDSHKADFEKMPLWRAWCLRKRAVKLYQRDKNNPEVAIAFLDEVNARLCFWEMLFRHKGKYRVKDLDLTKECGRIKNLIYKRFTYYIAGARLHRVDKYLSDRRSHREKIRAAWKKANP